MYILFLYERSLLLVFSFFSPFFRKSIANSKKSRIFAAQLRKTSCPDGGIGRRAGLKHQWIHFHPGSTPGLGTRKSAKYLNINT